MGKGWTIAEIKIVSEVNLKNYHIANFKIDTNGKFNPTKGATLSMNNFYAKVASSLLEQFFKRTPNSIQMKKPDFVEWVRLYKHAIENLEGNQ